MPAQDTLIINLLEKTNLPSLYINNKYPEKRLSLIFNELLSTTINLSWDDVCFSAKGQLNSKADNIVVAINILPLASNRLAESATGLAKTILFTDPDSPLLQGMFDNRLIQSSVFYKMNHKPSCISIATNEEGFLSRGDVYSLEQTLDKSTGKYLNKETRLSGGQDEPVQLTEAQLEIKTNIYALSIKRFVVSILLIGLFVTIWNIFRFIFPISKNEAQ